MTNPRDDLKWLGRCPLVVIGNWFSLGEGARDVLLMISDTGRLLGVIVLGFADETTFLSTLGSGVFRTDSTS